MVSQTGSETSSPGAKNAEQSGRYVGELRQVFNTALFPLDPYAAPAVGLTVGIWLLLLDMISAEAPGLLRVTALFGSLLLISDASSGLRRAFARTGPVIGSTDHPEAAPPPVPGAATAPSARAYTPAETEEVPEEPKKRRLQSDNPVATVSLLIALLLGLAALGPSTTSMRLLSMAATILICIRVYDTLGLRRD